MFFGCLPCCGGPVCVRAADWPALRTRIYSGVNVSANVEVYFRQRWFVLNNGVYEDYPELFFETQFTRSINALLVKQFLYQSYSEADSQGTTTISIESSTGGIAGGDYVALSGAVGTATGNFRVRLALSPCSRSTDVSQVTVAFTVSNYGYYFLPGASFNLSGTGNPPPQNPVLGGGGPVAAGGEFPDTQFLAVHETETDYQDDYRRLLPSWFAFFSDRTYFPGFSYLNKVTESFYAAVTFSSATFADNGDDLFLGYGTLPEPIFQGGLFTDLDI